MRFCFFSSYHCIKLEIRSFHYSGPGSVVNWLYEPRKSLTFCEPQFTHLPNLGAGQNDLCRNILYFFEISFALVRQWFPMLKNKHKYAFEIYINIYSHKYQVSTEIILHNLSF